MIGDRHAEKHIENKRTRRWPPDIVSAVQQLKAYRHPHSSASVAGGKNGASWRSVHVTRLRAAAFAVVSCILPDLCSDGGVEDCDQRLVDCKRGGV